MVYSFHAIDMGILTIVHLPVVSNLKLAEDVESKGTSREYAIQSLKVQTHLANLPKVSTQRN